ncbi:MAG TPA: glycosyltransferase family 4 protein [Pyrinomonadaceae bacterium]
MAKGEEQRELRVLRIAHSSLTPALRERERAVVRNFPNVQLEVVTTNSWREAEIDVPAQPDDLFPVRSAGTHLSKHIQLFAYDPRPIIAALREHRPHLIDMNHEPYSVACAEVLTLCARYAPNAPVVMQTAQNILRRYPFPFNWLEQRAFRKVAAAYVCSESVREVLRAKGFTRPASIIPFGVDLKSFKQRTEKRTSGRTIGYVGRMLPGKGLNVLADALKQMRHDDWQLLVVGDGSERESFTRELSKAGLLERVRFTGAVSYELTPEYFQEIDVLVVPTQTTDRIREQFGRVIVEAMASGVPVVGSTCGAIPEVIANAGLVFPEGDGQALAAAIRKLLGDSKLRERFSQMGRVRVEENYSWDHVAGKTYALYHQVLGRRTHPEVELEKAA